MNSAPEPNPLVQRLFAAKEQRRRDLAALPVEAKFDILLRLQRIGYEAALATHRPARPPWKFATQTH